MMTNHTNTSLAPVSASGDPRVAPSGEAYFAYMVVTVEAALGVLICLGNLLVFAVFCRNRSLRTVSNLYLLQLAITDFGVGLIMPLYMAMQFPPMQSCLPWCLVSYSFVMTFMAASMASLVAMTIDRYIAITRPFSYHETMTTRVSGVTIGAIWIGSVLVGFVLPGVMHNRFEDLPSGVTTCDFMYIIKKEVIQFVALPGIWIFLVMTVVMYGKILVVAKSHSNAIHNQQSLFQTRKDLKAVNDRKLVKAGVTILGAFCLCWSPYGVVLGIQVYGGQIYNDAVIRARYIAMFIAALNSCLNPMIYAYSMADIRKDMKEILKIESA